MSLPVWYRITCRCSGPVCQPVADGRSSLRRQGQSQVLDAAAGHQISPDIADVLDDAAQCRLAELDVGVLAGCRGAFGSALTGQRQVLDAATGHQLSPNIADVLDGAASRCQPVLDVGVLAGCQWAFRSALAWATASA